MTGFDVSSFERYTGMVALQVTLDPAPEDSTGLVRRRVETFLDALDAGFFFPGRRISLAPLEVRTVGLSMQAQLQVDELPVAALAVLGGMLADFRHHGVHIHDAHALLGLKQLDLLSEVGVRPEAPESPPFEVVFPEDVGGNYALLVEIEFARPMQPDVGKGLLETLSLWDTLTLAYPNDPDDPVEVSGAQAMFNDPCTIHYHEWVWDNADAEAWDLIVNLCCVWHRRHPIVRLQFE